MLEIEFKSACGDLSAVKRKIMELGGTFQKTETEEDHYFAHPARDFARTDEALRVRSAGGKYYLTYKGPKLGGPAKTRLEHQVAVASGEETEKILHQLGFGHLGTVRKTRQLYTLGDATICLDRVEELGDFVEIEMLGEDRRAIEKKLTAQAAELGLSGFITSSYLEMLLQKEGKDNV